MNQDDSNVAGPPQPLPGIREAGQGVRWRLIGNSAEKILNLAALPLLFRFVDRKAWGLVLLATAISALVGMLRDLGIFQAIVRSPNTSTRFVSTCFWMRLTFGVVLYLVLAVVAVTAAAIVDRWDVVPVLLVMGTTLFLDALPSIQQAVLTRDLRIRPVMQIRVVCVTLGVMASVLLAVLEFHEWALVANSILVSVLSGVILWFVTPWRPTFELDATELRPLFRFGMNLTGTQALGWFTEHFGVVALTAVGTPTQDLGYFGRAYVLGKWPDSLLGSVVGGGLATSFFAKIQNDRKRLQDALRRATRVMYLVGLPLSVVLIVLTEDFWSVIAGPRWSPAVLPCRIIAIGGTCLMMRQTLRHWLIAVDRPGILMRNQLVVAATSVVVTLAGARYGIEGVAVATTLACVVEFVLLWAMSQPLTGTTPLDWLDDNWRPIACAAIMAVALALTRWFLPQLANLTLRVLTEAFVGTTVWLLAAWLLCADDLMLVARMAMPSWLAGPKPDVD